MNKVILPVILISIIACKKNDEAIQPSAGSSTTFSVKKGNSFNVELPVGYSIGSTGVSWQLTISPDSKIVKVDSTETIENPKGASYWGTQVWHLKAVAVGRNTFQFSFIRPSAPSEVYNKKQYTVSVVE